MPYNLTALEAVAELHKESLSLEIPEVAEIDSSTAFQLGFETAIHRLREITGPDTMEVDVVNMPIPEESGFFSLKDGVVEEMHFHATVTEKKNSDA